jgi:hypothetical protein
MSRPLIVALAAACFGAAGCQTRPAHDKVGGDANGVQQHQKSVEAVTVPAPVEPATSPDTDGDGVADAEEIRKGTDPADYYNGVLPKVTSLVAEDGTLGDGGTLRVLITNNEGVPLVNAPITFRAKVGGHKLAATPDGIAENELVVRSNSQGIAVAYVRGGIQ